MPAGEHRTRLPAAGYVSARGQLLIDAATQAEGFIRQHRLGVAISFARNHNLRPLLDEATRLLQQMTLDELGMQRIASSLWLPRDASERYLSGFTRTASWAAALSLFLNSACPTGAYDDLVKQERDLARISVVGRLFSRSQVTHEGRPSWTATTEDQKQAVEIAWIASNYAQSHGQLLAEGLRRIGETYDLPDEDTLTVHLSMDGRAHVALSRSLARSLHLFWRSEYEASANVMVPKTEAAARALLLELDDAIYTIQAGDDQGGYVGLYALLTALEGQGMDPDWIYFLKWLLMGNPGANLRNDLTHGLVLDPGPITAALLIRAAALLIPLVAPESQSEKQAVGCGRQEVTHLVQHPVQAERPWPSRRGPSARAVISASQVLRLVSRRLDRLAQRMAP